MDFRRILEKAIELKGTGRAVAQWLNVPEQHITDAKGGRRGLPDRCCLQLAQLLGMDFGKVIAARNEWTAKSEEEKNFWHPLANAAGIAAISLCFVTSLLTPSPAQAAPAQALRSTPLCIM
jgi:plasmid maintenance system antidote protein VapI